MGRACREEIPVRVELAIGARVANGDVMANRAGQHIPTKPRLAGDVVDMVVGLEVVDTGITRVIGKAVQVLVRSYSPLTMPKLVSSSVPPKEGV